MRIALGDVRQGWNAKEEVSTPASFSRFVQPFAYSPVPDAGDPGSYVYKKVSVQGLSERENYLTVEMADALFRRALRLQLHPSRGKWDWRHPMRFGARDLDVCMHAPELLLFEWNEGRTEAPRKKQQPQGDLLRIGLLILDLYFPDEAPHADLRDLLSLNEAFRYWQKPYRQHAAVQNLLAQCPVSILQNELIGSLEGDQEIAEKAYFARWHDFLKPSLCVDGQHWKLFPEEAVDWGDLPEEWTDRRGYPEFFYADDKAFVWTCAVLKGPKAHLAKTGGTWAKLLNVDPPGNDLETCTKFEKEWIGKRTYDRWSDYGCLYGFNYHSGALAVPESCQVPAWDHFAKMYFDIAMILFYLRLASFRFSARLYRASAKIREEAGERTSRYWQEAFEDLRRSFSWFTNIYQFPLISNAG